MYSKALPVLLLVEQSGATTECCMFAFVSATSAKCCCQGRRVTRIRTGWNVPWATHAPVSFTAFARPAVLRVPALRKPLPPPLLPAPTIPWRQALLAAAALVPRRFGDQWQRLGNKRLLSILPASCSMWSSPWNSPPCLGPRGGCSMGGASHRAALLLCEQGGTG